MPAVNGHPDNYFIDLIHKMQADILALQTQQNGGVTDQHGVQRVRYGLLSNGDYGFAVADAAGNSRELLPMFAASTGASQGTSSAPWVDLATVGPSVTLTFSANQSAMVVLGATMTAPAGVVAEMTVAVDGSVTVLPLAQLGDAGASSKMTASVAAGAILFSTAGAHTLTAKYGATGGTATFFNRWLIVEPL